DNPAIPRCEGASNRPLRFLSCWRVGGDQCGVACTDDGPAISLILQPHLRLGRVLTYGHVMPLAMQVEKEVVDGIAAGAANSLPATRDRRRTRPPTLVLLRLNTVQTSTTQSFLWRRMCWGIRA